MKEEWRPVEGWCHYEVSNLGRVKSLHEKKKESGTNILKTTALKTSAGNIRMRVALREDGQRRGVSLKKLVASAFLPPPPHSDMQYIKHKDGDSGNCEANNLYYSDTHPNADSSPRRMKRHTSSVCL